MKKQEFLNALRKKLSILEESEIEDIISEYDGYIEEKIAKGSSEEEAVKSMGNVSELAKDLLSAYKVKNPEEKHYDSFNHLADGFMRVFDRIISVFANKSLNEILRFVIELVVIFLIIGICKLPFEIIENMGRSAFYSLGNGTFRVLGNIWEFILEFIYLIFAVLLFIKIFENRYLKDIDENKVSYEKKQKGVVKEKNSKKDNPVKEKKEVNNERHTKSIVDLLTDIFMLFVKMIVFFILIGVIFYNIGMAMTVGISIYLIIKGIFYFGIYLILLSLLVLGIVAFIFLYNFIFNRKSKTGVLLIITLVSFLIFGIGVGVSTIEFASTTILYNEKIEKSAKESITYDMKDNLVLSWDIDDTHIHIDDELKDKIKIEYAYDDTYFKIAVEPYVNRVNEFEILHPDYHVKEFKYSKDFLDKFLKDLKRKTIRVYEDAGVDIDIYMSNTTYEKIKENQKNYDKLDVYDEDDIYDLCEELEDRGYELPDYCPYYNHHDM